MVLCTAGRFETILIEPHIINKTTSGLRVRKNNQQVIHQNQWCFFQIIPTGCLGTRGRFYMIKIQPRVTNRTTCGSWIGKIIRGFS